MGEVDSFTVYPEPDIKILEKMRKNKTRSELWNNLPTEIYQLEATPYSSCRVVFVDKFGIRWGIMTE